MAEITAAMVQKLREMTGAGMMDCKKALVEANGDLEEAVTRLRKKGLASAAKKAGRVAAEGLVNAQIAQASSSQIGVLVEVNCETDFVARLEEFQKLVADVTECIRTIAPAGVDALLESKFPANASQTLRETVTEKIARIGENIAIRRFERYELASPGLLGQYVHAGGKIGVLVEVGCSQAATAQKSEFQTFVHDLAMHIAASNPPYLDRARVPRDVREREKQIARERALQQGKPEKIVDKIVEGQMEKFYSEMCLVDQPFVRDDKVTVGQLLAEKSKALGDTFTIRRYVRYKVGEGIEKRGTDPTAEVAVNA